MASEQFVIRLGMNSSGVAAGANSAVGHIQRIYSAANGLVALAGVGGIAGALVYLTKKTVDWASHLNDLSIQMGVNTEQLQAWEYAAGQTGVKIDDVSTYFKKFQKAQIEAIKGNKEIAESFQRAGLSISDLQKLKPQEGFEKAGEGLAKMGDSAQATVDTINILGKSGPAMVAAFKDGFSDASKKARELGLVVQDSVIQRLDSFGDKMAMIGKKMLVALAPAIQTLTTWTDKALTKIISTGAAAVAYFAAIKRGATREDAMQDAYAAAKKNEDQAKAFEKQLQDQIEANKNKKAKTPDETDTEPKKEKNPEQISDALAKFGGYRGGTGDFSRIPNMQLTELRSLNSSVRRLVTVTESKPVSPEVQQTIRGLQNLVNILTGQGDM